MNVAQLIEKLETFEPTMLVLQSSDEEGNDFNSTSDFSVELVDANYSGGRTDELYLKEDLEADDYSDAEIKANFKEVLVLWP